MRSGVRGSTRDARRTGSHAARTAVRPRTTTEITYVRKSVGMTPCSTVAKTRDGHRPPCPYCSTPRFVSALVFFKKNAYLLGPPVIAVAGFIQRLSLPHRLEWLLNEGVPHA